MSWPYRFSLVLVFGCAAATSKSVQVPGVLTETSRTQPGAAPIAPATECYVSVGTVTGVGDPTHHDACTPITYATVPPAGGEHYATWAAYKTYTKPVPWGFLVHNMEHGAVVIAYKCATRDACPALADEIAAVVGGIPQDPTCSAAVRNRIIVAPNPDLDVSIVAASWGHAYRATCMDAASLRSFIDGHYAMGREDTCSNGFDGSTRAQWCP